MRDTESRRRAILSLISSRAIHTQDELCESLSEQGFAVSQASISRDIAALGLTKLDGRYVRLTSARPVEDSVEHKLRRNVLAVGRAGDHLVVVTTPPGEASAVALAIDRLSLKGAVGTVAGDDTLFIAMDSGSSSRAAVDRITGIVT